MPTRFLVQLDEPERKPMWFNKWHAWTNGTEYATKLTRAQAERVAAEQRAKPFPSRTITIIEATK